MAQKTTITRSWIIFFIMFGVAYLLKIIVKDIRSLTAYEMVDAISSPFNTSMLIFFAFYMSELQKNLLPEVFKTRRRKVAILIFLLVWIVNSAVQMVGNYLQDKETNCLKSLLFHLGTAVIYTAGALLLAKIFSGTSRKDTLPKP